MINTLKFISLFVLLYSPSGFAQMNWKYKSFPVLPRHSDVRNHEPYSVSVGKTHLIGLTSRDSGTHRIWGVDQVYLAKNLKKKIFVKYNVEITSVAPIGGWMKFKKGYLLHLKQKNNKLTAFFADGFNQRELQAIQKNFRKRLISKAPWWSPIPCAHAEVTNSGDFGATGFDSFIDEPARPTSHRLTGLLERAENVITCVGSETINNAVEKGQELWESASWANIRNSAGSAFESVAEVMPTSLEDVQNGLTAAGDGIVNGASWVWERISDPVGTWNAVTESFEKTKQIFAQVYQEISGAISGFADLPPEVQDRLICDAVSALAADGILGVALGATGGGAAIAVARLLRAARNHATRITRLMPELRALVGSNIPAEERMDLLEDIMKGHLSESDRQRINGSAPGTVTGATVQDRIAAVRSMGEGERAAMLNANGALDDASRVAAAGRALGRELSEDQRAALIAAHNVAPERGFGSYTPADLLEKTRILRAAGFNADEADLLMRQGLAGRAGGPPSMAGTSSTPDQYRSSATTHWDYAQNMRMNRDPISAQNHYRFAAGEMERAGDMPRAFMAHGRAADLSLEVYQQEVRAGRGDALTAVRMRDDAINHGIQSGDPSYVIRNDLVTPANARDFVDNQLQIITELSARSVSDRDRQALAAAIQNRLATVQSVASEYDGVFSEAELSRWQARLMEMENTNRRRFGDWFGATPTSFERPAR